MISSRVLNVQREILARYDCISNLWVAYHNGDKFPDDIGREFFHAVGKILQGHSLDKLMLFHVDPKKIKQVVSHAALFDRAVNGSKTKTMTETKNEKGTQACRKQKRSQKRKSPRKKRKTRIKRTSASST